MDKLLESVPENVFINEIDYSEYLDYCECVIAEMEIEYANEHPEEEEERRISSVKVEIVTINLGKEGKIKEVKIGVNLNL